MLLIEENTGKLPKSTNENVFRREFAGRTRSSTGKLKDILVLADDSLVNSIHNISLVKYKMPNCPI
jgi:hypothetical protein